MNQRAPLGGTAYALAAALVAGCASISGLTSGAPDSAEGGAPNTDAGIADTSLADTAASVTPPIDAPISPTPDAPAPACGGLNEPCCASNACNAAYQCQGGTCKKGCGVLVAAGDSHSCATRTDGTLWCWGDNGSGQLGIGIADGTPRFVPTQTTGLTSVAAIGAGDVNTCAAKMDGTLWCWGNNFSGSLGLGAADGNAHPAPVQVPSFANAAEVTMAYVHTCARKSDTTMWCWGNDGAGQVGDGNTAIRPSPFQIPGLAVTAIAAGNAHSCGVRTDGAAFCWGYNAYGQIGDGTSGTPPKPPTIVAGNGSYTKIAAGTDHVCAIGTNGKPACWGAGTAGQLGTGVAASSSSPALVAGSLAALKISAAGGHTCVVQTDSSLWCWGDNFRGDLGDTTTTQRPAPVHVASLPKVLEIAVGGAHACAVDANGWVWCWGSNASGQLGIGAKDALDHPSPQRVSMACP